MQLIDFLLIAVIVIAVVFAVRQALKNRRSCCGDCASCRKSCAQQENKDVK